MLFFQGWTPSSFVSSRQNRADKAVLGPEDFMDEEVGMQNFHDHLASGMCTFACCSTYAFPRTFSG